MKNPAAVALGKIGGSARTETKSKTSAANGAKGGRPQKSGNYYYEQLCGALGVLKSSGENLPWVEINETLRKIAADNGPFDCDIDEVKAMHRQYRDRCLRLKLLNPGELFDLNDCIPII